MVASRVDLLETPPRRPRGPARRQSAALRHPALAGLENVPGIRGIRRAWATNARHAELRRLVWKALDGETGVPPPRLAGSVPDGDIADSFARRQERSGPGRYRVGGLAAVLCVPSSAPPPPGRVGLDACLVAGALVDLRAGALFSSPRALACWGGQLPRFGSEPSRPCEQSSPRLLPLTRELTAKIGWASSDRETGNTVFCMLSGTEVTPPPFSVLTRPTGVASAVRAGSLRDKDGRASILYTLLGFCCTACASRACVPRWRRHVVERSSASV